MSNLFDRNRNATIVSRTWAGKRWITKTAHRDVDSANVVVSTSPITHVTRLTLRLPAPNSSTLELDGRTARTLYRVLHKHYSAA